MKTIAGFHLIPTKIISPPAQGILFGSSIYKWKLPPQIGSFFFYPPLIWAKSEGWRKMSWKYRRSGRFRSIIFWRRIFYCPSIFMDYFPRYFPESMVLREQLRKDPQFQVALELVQDREMYDKIITPADAKVTKWEVRHLMALLRSTSQRDARPNVPYSILRCPSVPHSSIPKPSRSWRKRCWGRSGKRWRTPFRGGI